MSGALLWKNLTGSDVLTVDISRRGEAVAAGAANGTVRLLSGSGGVRWSFDAEAPVRAVALSDGGDYLAAGAGERALFIPTASEPSPAMSELTKVPEEGAAAATQAGGEGMLRMAAIAGALAFFRRSGRD